MFQLITPSVLRPRNKTFTSRKFNFVIFHRFNQHNNINNPKPERKSSSKDEQKRFREGRRRENKKNFVKSTPN
jgi:hypothetical protein